MNTLTNPSPTRANAKRGPAEYFTGTPWGIMLAGNNATDSTVGNVTFEPGCRNN